MQLQCNGEVVGSVEQFEWKSRPEEEGKVTFMAPFEFDWSGAGEVYLELISEDESERYLVQRIQRADEGRGGHFVVADVKSI